MRSHGSSKKSDLMTFCTSGNLSNSAVGVLNSRSAGASRSGFGEGSAVRSGFCARAASMGAFDAGGVITVISVTPIR